MESNKKKAIIDAWGVHYSSDIDENGWRESNVGSSGWDKNYFEIMQKDENLFVIRPHKLSGITNNNGWIKIESKKDLPSKDFGSCFIFRNDEVIFGGFRRYSDDTFWFFNTKGEGVSDRAITHYKLVEFPEKPIY